MKGIEMHASAVAKRIYQSMEEKHFVVLKEEDVYNTEVFGNEVDKKEVIDAIAETLMVVLGTDIN